MTKITKKAFGTTASGIDVDLFTLDNGKMSVDVITYGGTIVAIRVPDQNGEMKDVALGYETVGEYETGGGYVGALIGRCCSRIRDAEFELNGKTYHVYKNDGEHSLHGGKVGFDKKVWNAEVVEGKEGQELKLSLFSPDGEENYPGNLNVTVTYRVTEKNGLVLDYHAVTDRDTVCSLTNHAYFNLAGQDSGTTIWDQELKLDAEKYTDCGVDTIPNGIINDVVGTPFDFLEYHELGERAGANDPVLNEYGGYDHNFVLNRSAGDPVSLVAEAFCPSTGIKMEVYTNKPCVQLYCGNGLSEKVAGKGGVHYCKNAGFCLETQFFPNAMKHKNFPSPVLRAGDVYSFTTEYRFSVGK